MTFDATGAGDAKYQTVSPVLFLIFNRPDTTQQIFDAIRKARPPRLYIAADGPRLDRIGEKDKCEAARAIANKADWNCHVETLFRDEHLGCGAAVSEAITWFFSHEEEGIILEDDCLPEPSFFRFVDELLDRYRDDNRIAAISGNNFQTKPRRDDRSYYYSMFNHVWGWASWRRAWRLYDHGMNDWPKIRDEKWLVDALGSIPAAKYWAGLFEKTWKGNIDSWDYRWTFAVWREGMIAILPKVNLVKNIGFRHDATHTTGSNAGDPSSVTQSMDFPLHHPSYMIIDRMADKFTIATHFRRISLWKRVIIKLKKIINLYLGKSA